MSIKLEVPSRQLVTQTSQGDPVLFHYVWLVGYIYRRRLYNTLKLIGSHRFNRLLEVGYGSGIFLPTLSQIGKQVWALDIHKKARSVRRLLDAYKIYNVILKKGDIMDAPFTQSFFDAIVIVSALEDMPDARGAIFELKRIVKKGGHLFISFPVENIITNTFFRLVGENPYQMHPSNHRVILDSLRTHFYIKKILTYPSFASLSWSLYISVHARKK